MPEPEYLFNARRALSRSWLRMKMHRESIFDTEDDKGPLIRALKRFFGHDAWHIPVEQFTRHRLLHRNLTGQRQTRSGADAEFVAAVEWFWIYWTIGLVALYVAAFGVASYGPHCRIGECERGFCAFALFVFLVIAIYRVLDILAVVFRLFVFDYYSTNDRVSALVLTFLAYIHQLICFGVIYLAEGYYLNDTYNCDSEIWAGPLNSIYFSTVTITTLGFGDYAPERWWGRLAVIIEVLVGLAVIVVALQQVVAQQRQRGEAGDSRRKRRRRPGR